MIEVASYMIQLSLWLTEQGIKKADYPNPMVGTWADEDSDDLFVFTDNEFTWYDNDAALDGDCRRGTYGYSPGTKTSSGWELTYKTATWYTLFPHYSSSRSAGSEHIDNYYGIFTVMVNGDEIYMGDQRTDQVFNLRRV